MPCRAALTQTIHNRLEAVSARKTDEPPTRAEVRELQADLPLGEANAERIASRIVRTGLAREARRREAEKKQLKTIAKLLDQVAERPDPKLAALARDLKEQVLAAPGEKAIVFTEYRDTLDALRSLLAQDPAFGNAFVELTGGLSARQRKARIARFHEPDCRILLATDAASEGLNLQKHCHRLYHVELPWNPNRLEQRNGRIDRHGQTQPPLIKYLFHADSPEDCILDRLIQRISRMHDDRVSTPDILGVVESSRLESALGSVDSMADAQSASESLIKVFDERAREFAADVAPLFLGVPDTEPGLPFGNAVSADPMLEDDEDFEQLMTSALYGGLSAGPLAGTWRITVPQHLQGTEVEPRYACATFRRSVAIQYPASDVEFIHRLHPLFRALFAHALRELTLAPFSSGASTARVAVRRHVQATAPLAVFTYLEQRTDAPGQLVAVAVDVGGQVLPVFTADALLAADSGPPGDVPWALCESTFCARFEALQQQADRAALARLHEAVIAERARRAAVAGVMREEAALYRVDRRAEIDREEREEAAGAREQMVLFRDTSTPWKARRAAVETHYTRRLGEINDFAAVPDAQPPQSLGVLLVFPQA